MGQMSRGISSRDLYGGSDVVRSKYGVAKKADRTMDGITFDSKAEMKRYAELRLLERAGEVRDIELQPEFVLVEPFIYRGKRFRGVKYVADFRYRTMVGPRKALVGEVVVEDVKGFRTADYRTKKALFLSLHPDINFVEIESK